MTMAKKQTPSRAAEQKGAGASKSAGKRASGARTSSAARTTSARSAAKPTVARKSAASSAAAAKKSTKKAVTQSAAGKASAARTSPAKKASVKKISAKSATGRTTAAKSAAGRKSAAKAPVKKVAAKAAPKKTVAKAASKKAAKPAAKPRVKKQVKASAPAKAAPKKAAAKPAAKTAAKSRATASAASQTDRREVERNVTPPPEAAAAPPLPEVLQPTGSYNGIQLSDNVKPFPKKSPYNKKELDSLMETLSRERDQLVRELASLESTSREVMDLSKEHPGYSLHLAEHATDLQTAEASIGVRTIISERLEQVDTALRRLRENPNHFGLCLACGAKIGIQRLLARPHAHLCMDCRTRYERIRSRRGY